MSPRRDPSDKAADDPGLRRAFHRVLCKATRDSGLLAGLLVLVAFPVATTVAYLSTAGLIAVVAQLYRYQSGWRQFVIQSELGHERERNDRLVTELRRLSHEDDLTGVANLRAWALWIGDGVLRAKRSGAPLSVIYCDFDRFREVNDRHGHAVGDDVLQTGAAILRSRARGQ